MEFTLQFFAVILVLGLIVWLVFKTYGKPHSEYGKVLEQIPDVYHDLDDQDLQKEIDLSLHEIHRLEHELQSIKHTRKAKRHKLRKKIAALRIGLMLYEQHRRTLHKEQ